jgi:hypothetical protein
MAKDSGIEKDMFKRTEPQQQPGDNSDLEQGRVSPLGIGLTGGEIAALDAIAEQYNLSSRHQLLKLAVRLFILQVRSGELDLSQYVNQPEVLKAKINMPK